MHNVLVVNEKEEPFPEAQNNYPIRKARDFNIKQWKKGETPAQTASFFYQNIFNEMSLEDREIISKHAVNGDSLIISCLLMYGKIRVLEEVMSAYRFVQSGGNNWNSLAHGRNYCLKYYQQVIELEQIIKEIYRKDISFDGLRFRQLLSAIVLARKTKADMDIEVAKKLWKIEKSKIGFLCYVISYGIKRMFRKSSY